MWHFTNGQIFFGRAKRHRQVRNESKFEIISRQSVCRLRVEIDVFVLSQLKKLLPKIKFLPIFIAEDLSLFDVVIDFGSKSLFLRFSKISFSKVIVCFCHNVWESIALHPIS